MMKTILGATAIATVMALSAGSASATVYPLGTLLSTDTVGLAFAKVKGSSTPYQVDYTFTLTAPEELTNVSLTGSASPPGTDTFSGITGNTFELFSGSVGSGIAVPGQGDVDTSTKYNIADSIGPVTIAAGTYYLEAVGTYDPTYLSKGKVVADTTHLLGLSGTLSVSAVPEVSTWVMMMLGFAGLGFAGYRSRRSVDVAV